MRRSRQIALVLIASLAMAACEHQDNRPAVDSHTMLIIQDELRREQERESARTGGGMVIIHQPAFTGTPPSVTHRPSAPAPAPAPAAIPAPAPVARGGFGGTATTMAPTSGG
jgi:hypothetical protein